MNEEKFAAFAEAQQLINAVLIQIMAAYHPEQHRLVLAKLKRLARESAAESSLHEKRVAVQLEISVKLFDSEAGRKRRKSAPPSGADAVLSRIARQSRKPGENRHPPANDK
jgi:hypothetical protein